MKLLAIPGGLEPPTSRLEGGCSIQLSYGTTRRVFCAKPDACARGRRPWSQGSRHENRVGIERISAKRPTFFKAFGQIEPSRGDEAGLCARFQRQPC